MTNLTLSQGIGSLLTELSSQLNTGIALPPVGEVTQKAIELSGLCFLLAAPGRSVAGVTQLFFLQAKTQ